MMGFIFDMESLRTWRYPVSSPDEWSNGESFTVDSLFV